MNRTTSLSIQLLLALPAVVAMAPASADDGQRWGEGIGYYIGVDTLTTVASGTFAGLANPNAMRLTFLYDHGDHFHSIGAYSYSGTAAAPVVQNTNANNRIPELYTRTNPANSAIPFMAGTGALAGTWASGVLAANVPTYGYSHLGVASIQTLDGMSAGADVLFHSSNNRWNADFQGITVGLQLVSATAGLKVAVGNALDIFNGSTTFALGDSRSLESWPIFYVDGGSADGVYSAQFQLVNLGNNPNVRGSGTFNFDFSVAQPVPEPSTWLTMLAGMAALSLVVARRRKRS